MNQRRVHGMQNEQLLRLSVFYVIANLNSVDYL